MKIAICDKIGLCYDGTTLEKHGLGGSESAVILMSRELQQLGFNVTVFNNCNDSTHSSEGTYNGVRYIDNSNAANHNEEYDIVIVSRTAEPFLNKNRYPFLKSAKMKALWLHDTFCEGDQHVQNLVVSGEIDYIFTLSDFHTDYVLNCDHGQKRNYEVLKHKVFQTRNGAVKYIDEVDINKKDRNHFVYNASVTKGLVPLLEHIWPEIKKQIPQAHLTVIGGYYRFREGAEPDAQEKTLRKLVEDDRLKELDITFTDVIPQPKIAEILANATFMLYPGAFPETFGISTLESLLYNTPLITTKFGALEETAVAGACYTMDFAIEPNNLFPYINKEGQIKQFVQMTVDAYNNPYLLQQKQNYCSVVQDVAGWDSVAIEWKRFFYHKLGKFLPAEDYRVAKIINQKVNRVFGRVNNMPNYREYISFGKQRGILIVSPFYNCENYISNCILSVAQQDYENYVHVLIDDCSTDNSFEVAKRTIDSLPPEVRSKFSLQKNLTNRGAVYNQITAIDIHGEDDDIVMLLDGDDWLVNNNTLFHLYNDYYNYGAEFTYGSCWSLVDNIPLVAQDYPESVKQNRSYREHKFNWNMPYTHLRTFKKSLINDIDQSEFKDENGEWYRAGGDGSVFYSLIERANPENIIALKEIVYAYNDVNPLNDYKINGDEQNRNAAKILSKTKKENMPVKLSEHIKEQAEKFTIVVPTMWRCLDIFKTMLYRYSIHEKIDEIIIINNDVGMTPEWEILKNSKIKLLNQSENIKVNPAWNLGVNTSKNNKICIVNDDIIFDIKLFDKVYNYVTPYNGVTGLLFGKERLGHPATTDKSINIKKWKEPDNIYGFGQLMFIHKENWKPIIDDLEIGYGDDFIFHNCLNNGLDNHLIYNIDWDSPLGATSGDKSITGNYHEREKQVWENWVAHKNQKNKKKEENSMQRNKRILIAIPTSKYIEPETFKSIYDLDVPEGYETEFQFFYGYSRVQVKNLICEWAKHYDYTCFIKENNSLDKNILKIIINSNKDVYYNKDKILCSKQSVFKNIEYPHFSKMKTDNDEIFNFIEKCKKIGANVYII